MTTKYITLTTKVYYEVDNDFDVENVKSCEVERDGFIEITFNDDSEDTFMECGKSTEVKVMKLGFNKLLPHLVGMLTKKLKNRNKLGFFKNHV